MAIACGDPTIVVCRSAVPSAWVEVDISNSVPVLAKKVWIYGTDGASDSSVT